MRSDTLDEMLTKPSKKLDPRIEPSQYHFSPWFYYAVRREFRLMSLKDNLTTINIVAVLGPEIEAQDLHYAYKDCMIVYPDLSDHDI